jgi:4-aminobutyrate aminotransferase/(S)-3-amino-2-methylpropionate transaminase
MDAPQVGGIGGTYGGNPLACAAALATIDSYESDNLVERAREIGAILTERLTALQAGDARIGEVRGRGAMMAIELVDPATGEPHAALTGRVAAAAHAAGVILLTCGTYGNVIRFLPPLSMPDHLLVEGLQVVADALAAA